MGTLSPVLRTPMTDLTGCLVNHQLYSSCANIEMKFMDCLEAYGMERGKKKCKDLFEDYRECHIRTKQNKRLLAMRMERHRQYLQGERKEHYAEPPKIDSY